jgi:hypothetical protein
MKASKSRHARLSGDPTTSTGVWCHKPNPNELTGSIRIRVMLSCQALNNVNWLGKGRHASKQRLLAVSAYPKSLIEWHQGSGRDAFCE